MWTGSKKQGVPEDVAKQMSKDVFAKAELQSAEKVLQIEEIRAEKQAEKTETKMIVVSGNQSEEVDITDNEKAATEISEKFSVPQETAIIVVEKAQENIEEHTEKEQISESDTKEFTDEIDNFEYDEKDIPPMSDWIPDDSDIPPEMPDFGGNFDIPDMETPEIEIPTRGGR